MTSESTEKPLPVLYLGLQLPLPAVYFDGKVYMSKPVLRLVTDKTMSSKIPRYSTVAKEERALVQVLEENVDRWYLVRDSLPLDVLTEEKILPSKTDDYFEEGLVENLDGFDMATLLNEQGALPPGLGSKYRVAERVLPLHDYPA